MAVLTRNPNLDVQHHKVGCNFRELISEKDDPDLYGIRPEWWWTGKKPKFGECPGVGTDGVITSLAMPKLSKCSREQALAYCKKENFLSIKFCTDFHGRRGLTNYYSSLNDSVFQNSSKNSLQLKVKVISTPKFY